MPSVTGSRTPGYRFKNGKLMIFRKDEVMLIQGWDAPTAVCRGDDLWKPFVPEFRLVAPYRRSPKPASNKNDKTPPAPSLGSQLAFDLWDTAVSKKPAAPKPPPLAEQRKRAFDGFRCEYRENPLGIDAAKPRLSWQIVEQPPFPRSPVRLPALATAFTSKANSLQSPPPIKVVFRGAPDF